eukprot:SAG31_NODE_7_length_42755_cov_130.245728_26_plen_87_part_00
MFYSAQSDPACFTALNAAIVVHVFMDDRHTAALTKPTGGVLHEKRGKLCLQLGRRPRLVQMGGLWCGGWCQATGLADLLLRWLTHR